MSSENATLVGATPVEGILSRDLRHDEPQRSEKVRSSPNVPTEASVATSVLGGGEEEEEQVAVVVPAARRYTQMSMSMSMKDMTVDDDESKDQSENKDVDLDLNKNLGTHEDMHAGGSNMKSTSVNGGGSLLKTAINLPATRLLLNRANAQVAELGNQMLHAASNLVAAELERESTV